MPSLDPLISNVVFLLESEASLVANVGDELREMKRELETMRSFLKDADSATLQTELQPTWVSQVRDSAFEIEDIIDEFEYRKNKCRALGKFKSFLHKSVHFPEDLWLKRRQASKLQKVKSSVVAISNRRQRYKADQPIVPLTDPHNWLRAHHESALFLRNDEVVGFENAKNKIKGWLLREERERIVISVWGFGGSGKTTLVANVYNNPRIKRHFDCCAWVTVSQTYEIRDILAAIIKDFCKSRNEQVPGLDVSSMDYRSLVDFLVNYLESKRYVIVLADVWDLGLWNKLRVAFPNNMQGSRVMISTRHQEVACSSFGVQSYVHHNEPLLKHEAFDLFCKKAFSDKVCPDNLRVTASKLVDRCEGLPLALVALGGAMFHKSESEWRMVDSSLTWQLDNNPDLQNMKTILLLSYHALPPRLKLCFLYCSVFPEDYLMPTEKLTQLWLAEGFLDEVEGSTPEQVAELYLMELVRRSLLQVVEFDPSGLPAECFNEAINGVQVTPYIGRFMNLQVLMTIQANDDLIRMLGSLTNLRELYLEQLTEEMEKEMCLVIKKMKYLHALEIMAADENVVLHLESLISTAPRLKYLSLCGKLEKAPSWFPYLHNLNDLLLYWTRSEDDILCCIDALPNLTKLSLYNACCGERLHFGKGFQKLKLLFISSFPHLKQITVEKGVVPIIERLVIGGCEELETAHINYLTSLQTIVLKKDASSVLVNQIREEFRG